jgi:hypothetical protein
MVECEDLGGMPPLQRNGSYAPLPIPGGYADASANEDRSETNIRYAAPRVHWWYKTIKKVEWVAFAYPYFLSSLQCIDSSTVTSCSTSRYPRNCWICVPCATSASLRTCSAARITVSLTCTVIYSTRCVMWCSVVPLITDKFIRDFRMSSAHWPCFG